MDTAETATIQAANELVKERVEALRAAYSKQDDLDIALMCCLDIAHEFLQSRNETARKDDTVHIRAQQVVAQLQQMLRDIQPTTAEVAELDTVEEATVG